MSSSVAVASNPVMLIRYYEREVARMRRHNRGAVSGRRRDRRAIAQRRAGRLDIVLTCMDERTTLVEEALGLLPGQAEVFASAGAQINIECFQRLFARRMAEAEEKQRAVAIWLVTHHCADHPQFGCAAFQNDLAKQKSYFNCLRIMLRGIWPQVFVHEVLLDTASYGIEPLHADERDAVAAKVFERGGCLSGFPLAERAHDGYGIYVGDAYRAWVSQHNTYFRMSTQNPTLIADIGVALRVMRHHSQVNLERTPIVLQIDTLAPIDSNVSASAEEVESAVEKALTEPLAQELMREGLLKVVRTMTDAETWRCLNVR